MPLSGVFLYWRSARVTPSVFNSPELLVLSRNRRFAALTASSALPLLCA